MDKIILLDAFTADQGEPLWEPLKEFGEVHRYDRTDDESIVERIGDASYVLTNKVPITAETMKRCPQLKYVGILATGYNVIDIEAAREHGIAVANAPGYSTDSVAQLVMAFMLSYFNKVERHNTRVQNGEWAGAQDFCFFDGVLEELAGKTLLIIGKGAIGGAVERIAEAFGMRVLAGQVPGRPSSPDRTTLEEALPEADVISLHCPLTAQTNGLVDGTFLAKCRSDAVLINTGRGQLLDNQAVLYALDNGMLARVYADVLDQEPPAADHPLIGHDRVVLTPHIGWGTVQARQRLARIVINNLAAFRNGDELNRIV